MSIEIDENLQLFANPSRARYLGAMYSVKAARMLSQNIEALLRARHQSGHDLAQWCHHSNVWISNFLSGKRQIQLKDLDRIADFFGLATYQLFQPGISPLTERRAGLDRRAAQDRRVGHAHRAMLTAAADIEAHRPPRKGAHVVVAASSPLMEALQQASAEHARRVDAIISRFAASGGQAPAPRDKKPPARPRRRAAGGSDAPTD